MASAMGAMAWAAVCVLGCAEDLPLRVAESRVSDGQVIPLPDGDSSIPRSDSQICSPLLSACDGECVDLQTHPMHCGICGNTCLREECIAGRCPWQQRLPLNVQASLVTATEKTYPVEIILRPESFPYEAAQADGNDLRFASAAQQDAAFDLPYWIEQWNPTGESQIWVALPSDQLASGTTIYLFFNHPTAAAVSSRDEVFVKRFISSANVSLEGIQEYDWFELKQEHTINVPSSLTLHARRLIIEGTIEADGSGYGPSLGPGRGSTSSNAGAGGAGHGGFGGRGAYDSFDSLGAGGPVYDGDEGVIEAGSGGANNSFLPGNANYSAGGAGGGALSFHARDVLINGTLSVNGMPGEGGGNSGGGGSGGGILLIARSIFFSDDSRCSAVGGHGGDGSATSDDGGGGGGGGRIKFVYDRDGVYHAPATVDVAGGRGGAMGQVAAQAGDLGTFSVSQKPFVDVLVTPGSVETF